MTERVHRFGRHETLVGIVSRSRDGSDRIPVLILGAGIIHKVGPSRASVRVARALALDGHTVLRFDLSGIGDSIRAPDGTLESVVKDDIRDAVAFLLEQSPEWSGGVCIVGFCSGADNALHMAAEEERIRDLVLFDPTIHRTSGFRRRRALRRLREGSVSDLMRKGQAWLSPRDQSAKQERRPPGYYGLLVGSPEERDRRAAAAVERGVHFLFCLSRGAHGYCDSPMQVRESLPTGYSDEQMTIAWRPTMDHVLSDIDQQEDFIALVRDWLDRRRRSSGRSDSTAQSTAS